MPCHVQFAIFCRPLSRPTIPPPSSVGADHYVFVSNEGDVSREIRAFLTSVR
jgi:hypothetical protein